MTHDPLDLWLEVERQVRSEGSKGALEKKVLLDEKCVNQSARQQYSTLYHGGSCRFEP